MTSLGLVTSSDGGVTDGRVITHRVRTISIPSSESAFFEELQTKSASFNGCLSTVEQGSESCRNCGLLVFILCLVATASVIIHILICVKLNDKGGLQRNLPVPAKRRKLRKRTRFELSESSSDCSM